MTTYSYNDGGRAASGRKGKTGDCGVRAMAIALGIDYDLAYRELAEANRQFGFAKSARNGLHRNVYDQVLARHGWIWTPAPRLVGRKARCSDLAGTVIARQAHHYVAVIDGIPQDVFDSSMKMVYGYYEKR